MSADDGTLEYDHAVAETRLSSLPARGMTPRV
jgi:hypothetical protein